MRSARAAAAALGLAADATQRAANDDAERETAIRAIKLSARGGFGAWAGRHLRIRDTAGRIVPFRLNAPQSALHEVVQAQQRDLGRVRIICLKARQLGISTYIAGRQYYQISRRTGQSGLVIAHDSATSAHLHSIVRTYHDHMDERFRPTPSREAGDLYFPGLRSGMTIATARNVDTGRGFTHQFLHASEVAYYPDAARIMKGAAQGVHDVGHTEFWMESTSAGPSGYFYTACQAARKGELGDFRFVFLPWFSLPGRVRTPEEGFADRMDEADRQYMALHGLSLEQMAWRDAKRQQDFMHQSSDLQAASIAFGIEFPAVPEDCFNAADAGSFIPVASVVRARRAYTAATVPASDHAPRILGVDPSWMGNDRFSVWLRQGRTARRACPAWKHASITQSVQRLLTVMEQERPDYVCIDAVGVGAGVYDLLVEVLESRRMPGVVFCVMAGSSAEDQDRHVLVRDECWSRMKDWLANAPQVALEDIDAIQADLTSVRNIGDIHRRIRLESKDQMRKRRLPSPDEADALANTFFLRETGTLGRAGTRSGGLPDPHRPFNYKIGG